MKNWLYGIISIVTWKQKRAFMIAVDLVCISGVTGLLTKASVFNFNILTLVLLPSSIVFLFYVLGVYATIPRFFGAFDASRIIFISWSTAFFIAFFGSNTDSISAIIGAVIVTAQCFLLRLIYADWRSILRRERSSPQKIIIVGAGSAGLQLLRSLKIRGASQFDPIGFVDDDRRKVGMRLDGVAVVGCINDVLSLKKRFRLDGIIIAIPSASSDEMRRILSICQQANLPIKTLPALAQLGEQKVGYKDVKTLEVEDLLGRGRVDLDKEGLERLLRDQVVLITGAGGSIGSELAMRVRSYGPRLLVLFEQSEIALYELDRRIKKGFSEPKHQLIIGDVRNFGDINKAIKESGPSLVIHAAAYKHVPLMELNPLQAIRNNVLGSRNVVRSSIANRVKNFILISTDKAVNPTNIMGASKRLAEISCQFEAATSAVTKFTAVRFGNVLGSSGSVIPLFREQISSGGPVTVTHPDITRYFMLIPEAAQLVLQASLLGAGGEIFVLDMGKPVKIVNLAETMIRSCGLVPGEDIEIVFTGLRPGEKLYEELLADSEKTIPTSHKKIAMARLPPPDPHLIDKITALLALEDATPDEISDAIHAILPEFTHNR